MDKIRDHQDAPIWNAIEANNFKQALKLVDKRLAKRRTDYLEVRREWPLLYSFQLSRPPSRDVLKFQTLIIVHRL
jgi:hypothetical protein